MKFVEELRKKDHLVSTMGVRARETARAAGASSFYLDPDSDDIIIEEKPDGTLSTALGVEQEELGERNMQSAHHIK